MTLGESKALAVKCMHEGSTNGTPVNVLSGAYLDYVIMMNPLANTCQMELCKIKKIPDFMTISQNPIPNLLGLYGMNEVQHFPGTDLTYSASGAKSFSLDVNGACSLKFEEYEAGVWQDINGTYTDGTETAFNGTIAVSGIKTYTNYKGLLTLTTATNSVRLTVTATYPMKSRYRALFGYSFADADSVPRYAAYVPYKLPADFMEFDKMMRAYDDRQFNENSDYKGPFKGKTGYEIFINWHLTGEFDIHYYKYPTVITDTTLDTYEFEVDIDAQSLIPWYIGGYAIYKENANLGVQLLNQYNLLKGNLMTVDTSQPGTVMTFDNGGW